MAGVSHEGFLVRLPADLTLRAQVLGHIPDARIYVPGDSFILAAVACPEQWASRIAYRVLRLAWG